MNGNGFNPDEVGIGFNEIIEILEKHGFNLEYEKDVKRNGFSRMIHFSDENGQRYFITWWKNKSTLYIGSTFRSCQFEFMYIYYDTCFPMSGGNSSLAFSNIGEGIVRIPCPINKN